MVSTFITLKKGTKASWRSVVVGLGRNKRDDPGASYNTRKCLNNSQLRLHVKGTEGKLIELPKA